MVGATEIGVCVSSLCQLASLAAATKDADEATRRSLSFAMIILAIQACFAISLVQDTDHTTRFLVGVVEGLSIVAQFVLLVRCLDNLQE